MQPDGPSCRGAGAVRSGPQGESKPAGDPLQSRHIAARPQPQFRGLGHFRARLEARRSGRRRLCQPRRRASQIAATEGGDRKLRSRDQTESVQLAHSNRANALGDLGRLEQALGSYDDSLRVKETADAWMGRGATLRRLDRFEEALAALRKAYAIEPAQPYLQGGNLYLKMQMAEWDGFESECELLFRNVEKRMRATHPGHLLSTPSTLELQQLAAETLARDKYPVAPVL